MLTDDSSPEQAVPEEVAHRLLARAAEIEARQGPVIPISQLRQVAEEAGISSAAFDQALSETRAPAPVGRLRRWGRSLLYHLSSVSPLPLLNQVTLNIVAFAATWVLVGLGTRLGQAIGAGWMVHNGLSIVATLLGLGMAVRVRARLTAVLLAIVAAAQLAEYPLQLIFGISVVQGAQTKVALLLAGGFGLLLSRILFRRSHHSTSDAPPLEAPGEVTRDKPDQPPDFPALRLQTLPGG